MPTNHNQCRRSASAEPEALSFTEQGYCNSRRPTVWQVHQIELPFCAERLSSPALVSDCPGREAE